MVVHTRMINVDIRITGMKSFNGSPYNIEERGKAIC